MSTSTPPDDARASDRLLECGRHPGEVIDRARAGTSTPHELGCPYCQATIAADSVARSAATELAEAERGHPVPATLLPNVMRSVWSDLRRSTMIPLPTDHGSAFIADHTVAAVIEQALDQLPAVRIHTCTVRLAPAQAATDTTAAGSIAIAVTAAAALNSDVRSVAAEVRELAGATVTEQFGMTANPIDIDIVDVYLPEGGQR